MPLHCREGSRLSAGCDRPDGWGSLPRCYCGACGRKPEFRDGWPEHLANWQLVNRKGARDPTIDSSLSAGVPAIGGNQENVHILKACPSHSETPSHLFTHSHPPPVEIAGLSVCETEEFKLPFFTFMRQKVQCSVRMFSTWFFIKNLYIFALQRIVLQVTCIFLMFLCSSSMLNLVV